MFYATHTSILTSARSRRPYGHPSMQTERSPTAHPSRKRDKPMASVLNLSPVTLSAQDRLTSELLRTL